MFTNDTAAPDLQSARRKAEAVRTAIYTAVCWANPWGRGRKLSLQALRGCFCCQAGRGGDPGLPVPPRSPPALLGAFPEDLGLGANGARGCPGPAQLGSCRHLCLPRFASRFSFAPKSTAPPSLKKKKSFYFPSPSGGSSGMPPVPCPLRAWVWGQPGRGAARRHPPGPPGTLGGRRKRPRARSRSPRDPQRLWGRRAPP